MLVGTVARAAARPRGCRRSSSSSTSPSSRSPPASRSIVVHALVAGAEGSARAPGSRVFARHAGERRPSTVLLIGAAISLSEGTLGAATLGQMLADGPRVTPPTRASRSPPRSSSSTDPRALPLLLVPARHRLPRLPRLPARAPAPRAPRVPLRGQPHARRARPRSSRRSRACSPARSRRSAPRSPRSCCSASDGSPPLRTTLRPRRLPRGDGADRRRDRRRAARARRRRPARSVRARAPVRHASACARYLEARGVTARDARDAARREPRDRHDHARQPLRRRALASATTTCGCSRRSPTTPASRSSTTGSSRRSGSCASSRSSSHHQAYHDPLTDLANRTLFIDRVDEALAAGSADGRRPVHRRRRLQDRQRHARPRGRRRAAGRGRRAPARTACARATSSRASAATSSPSCSTDVERRREDAVRGRRADHARVRSSPSTAGDEIVSVHLSVGIATSRADAADADELIRNADVAMYQAKAVGQGPLRALRPPACATAMLQPPRPQGGAAAGGRARRVRRSSTSRSSRSRPATSWPPRRSCAGTTRAAAACCPAEFVPLAEETGLIVRARPARARARPAARRARWQERTRRRRRRCT